MDKFSGLKVLYHPDHVKATLERRSMYPVHVNIDTINYCNHRCIWCSAYEEQQENHKEIDYASLVSALKEGAERGLKAVTHIGYGEPTLYSRFLELVKEIHSNGIEQGIFTNGAFPERYCEPMVKAFTWVRFSLDAASTPVHNIVHGKTNTFDSIIRNMKTLLSLRKGPESFTVGVQYALHQKNREDMVAAARLVKDLGADYFSVKPVIMRGAVGVRCDKFEMDPDRVLKDLETLSAMADDSFEVLYKPYQFQVNNTPFAHMENERFHRNYTRCYALNFEWWIRHNLDVDICGPMKKKIGNLKEQSYASILNSDLYRQVVENIDIDRCYRGCRPHYLNEAMHRLECPEFKIHRNFVG